MSRRIQDTQTFDLFEVPQPAAQLPASMDYGVLVAHMISSVLRDADCAMRIATVMKWLPE